VRGRTSGWWPFVTVAAVLAAASWLLYVVWRSPSQHRVDLATYGAFAAAVVTPTAGWIARTLRARESRADATSAGQDLDRVADLLATAVRMQWERAAGERGLLAEPLQVSWDRPLLPLAGPVAAAVGSRRFAPLPGLTLAREAQLVAGQIDDLHAIYGGLRSGRLVIAGSPGAGKSSAAVLLILDALKYRDQVRAEDRVKIPVPVLFTAQDWDPSRQPVREWLTGRLQQTYPLFTGRPGGAKAAGLIDVGKITVIIDGLDEIAGELRPLALQALDQVSFRVVVLSRSAEMASAASQGGMLQGAVAVELQAISPAVAASYLERIQLDPPPAGWRDLLNRIRARPASPLAEALNNPLALTLIRDTYRSGDDVHKLLDHCDTVQRRVSGSHAAEEITGHLLDRVVPAAYAPRPGQPPRYDEQMAQNALTKIAARMNQDGTRDLQWWHIPRWIPSAPRIVMGGLVTWLLVEVIIEVVVGVAAGLITRSVSWLMTWLVVGFAVGLVVAVVAAVTAQGVSAPPARMGRMRRPKLRRVFSRKSLKFGLIAWLVFGLITWLVFGLVAGLGYGASLGLSHYGVGAVIGIAFAAALEYGFTFGVFAWLTFGLANAFIDPDSTSSPSPTVSWCNDRRHSVAIGLVVGLVIGLLAGLVFGLGFGLSEGFTAGLETGTGYGLSLGLVAGFVAGLGISRAWPTTLAAAQLTKRWHTPLHLMRFLDDARERNVLRTVGPVYQFRHARLQDRLAATVANGSNNDHADQPLGSRQSVTIKRQKL
jgi:hypothetical protein